MTSKRELAVGDRVRLRGYSASGICVEGVMGTVRNVSNPKLVVVEVTARIRNNSYYVTASQCRRLKPKRSKLAVAIEALEHYASNSGVVARAALAEIKKGKV